MLSADDCALFLASSDEDATDALRLLRPEGLQRVALPVRRIPAPRQHGPPASAGPLSPHRHAAQAPAGCSTLLGLALPPVAGLVTCPGSRAAPYRHRVAATPVAR